MKIKQLTFEPDGGCATIAKIGGVEVGYIHHKLTDVGVYPATWWLFEESIEGDSDTIEGARAGIQKAFETFIRSAIEENGMLELEFIAAPYSAGNASPGARADRFAVINAFVRERIKAGHVCFSPISHSHPIAGQGLDPIDNEIWFAQAEPHLYAMTKLVILCLPGWEQSDGIAREFAVAWDRNVGIEWVTVPSEGEV